jgi:AraC-like DNA-binding protein
VINRWQPPFFLYGAGRDMVVNREYRNNPLKKNVMPRRLLIKRTLSGQGVLYIGKRRELLLPGDIFIIERTGPYMYCYESEGEPWKFEYVSIGFNSPANILPEKLQLNPIFNINGQAELESLLGELIATRIVSDYQPNLMHSALAYSFFLAYVNIRMQADYPVPDKIRKLKQILDRGTDKDLTITACCRYLGGSTEAMTRAFTAAYGISPGKYLQLSRLRLACELLRGDNKSIKEIAFACGFGSQNYFSRLFRKIVGVTPGEYRKNPDPLLSEMLYLYK